MNPPKHRTCQMPSVCSIALRLRRIRPHATQNENSAPEEAPSSPGHPHATQWDPTATDWRPGMTPSHFATPA